MSDIEHKLSLLLPSVHLHELASCDTKIPGAFETLEKYFNQNKDITNEERTNLLLQVSHCVLHLHQKDINHESLSNNQISVLKDICQDATKSVNANGDSGMKQTDINSLANVYCCILTNGEKSFDDVTEGDLRCADPKLAMDIMKQMANKKTTLTVEDILQHPFYWNDFQKASFICKAVDHINDFAGYRNAKTEENKKKIMDSFKMGEEVDVVTDKGWIEELKLKDREMMEIRKKQEAKGSTQAKLPVHPDIIYGLAAKPKDTKEAREKLVIELARFFRNRYTHFREDKKNVQLCFGSYPSGYLKFFTDRYPNFFIHVYREMKTYLCTKEGLGEFVTHQTSSQSLQNVHFCITSGGEEEEMSLP